MKNNNPQLKTKNEYVNMTTNKYTLLLFMSHSHKQWFNNNLNFKYLHYLLIVYNENHKLKHKSFN